MRKYYFISIIFLSLTSQIFPQGWFWQNPLPQGNRIYGVNFISPTVGWAVTDYGTILRTTNGGTAWTLQSSGTSNRLWSVSFTDANNGTTVGRNGTILRTTNGGTTWTLQPSGTTHDLRSVSFTDANNGTVVGNNGAILRTINGGTTWTLQTSGTGAWLFSVSFTDANNGTVVGSIGTILRTTNGGTTWTLQPSGTTHYLNRVSFTDANNGTAVGDYGTILRTTNGGTTFVEENKINEIPTNYSISQNYPNPFNPSTKIRYSVPQSSNVVIKVFDILGNEIETLVNEQKAIGTYEITWYAKHLPSGVYFYQLRAGSFIETKKMILIK